MCVLIINVNKLFVLLNSVICNIVFGNVHITLRVRVRIFDQGSGYLFSWLDSKPSGGGVFSVSRAQPEIKFLVQPESEHISTANFITYFPVSHQSL